MCRAITAMAMTARQVCRLTAYPLRKVGCGPVSGNPREGLSVSPAITCRMVGRLGTLRRHLCSGDTRTTRGSGSASAGSAHSTPPQLSQNHVYDQLLQEAVNDGGEWIEIDSGGTTLRGLLLPPHPPPKSLIRSGDGSSTGAPSGCVVMAHGFGCTFAMGILPYAAAFQAAGLRVLLFDHMGFGRSEGLPRRQIDWFEQAAGYCAAVDTVRGRLDVDADRVAVWGESFAANLVLAVGAVHEGVKAVVSISPPNLEGVPAEADPDKFATLAKLILNREFESAKGRPVAQLPVVPDEHSAQAATWFGGTIPTTDQCSPTDALANPKTWFLTHGSRDSTWVNDSTMVSRKTPVRGGAASAIHFLRAPTLMIATPEDEIVALAPCVAAFAAIPARVKEFVEIGGGHFGHMDTHNPSIGTHPPEFHAACATQVAFLKRVLL